MFSSIFDCLFSFKSSFRYCSSKKFLSSSSFPLVSEAKSFFSFLYCYSRSSRIELIFVLIMFASLFPFPSEFDSTFSDKATNSCPEDYFDSPPFSSDSSLCKKPLDSSFSPTNSFPFPLDSLLYSSSRSGDDFGNGVLRTRDILRCLNCPMM